MKKMPKINLDKYKTYFSGYKHTISFVGNPSVEGNLKVLCELIKVFKTKINIFSTEKLFKKSIEIIKEKNFLNEEYLIIYSNCYRDLVEKEEYLSNIYNSSKINLNIDLKGTSLKNLQLFEILASGGFLITNEKKDLADFFKPSKHLETYKNTNDLIDKIDFYLKNLDIAQKIAQNGKFELIKNSSIYNQKH